MEEHNHSHEVDAAVAEAPRESIVGQHEYLIAGGGQDKNGNSGLDVALRSLKEDGVKVLGFTRDRGGNWNIKTMAKR